jgi:hypothetical protein
VKVYFDANVLSYACRQHGTPAEMEMAAASLGLLQAVRGGRFEGITSLAAVAEIGSMDDEQLKRDTFRSMDEFRIGLISADRIQEAERLAQLYRGRRALPVRKGTVDSLHLAWATVAGAEVLVSWNRRHLVRLKTRAMAAIINVRLGYRPVDVQTPVEVLRETQEG